MLPTPGDDVVSRACARRAALAARPGPSPFPPAENGSSLWFVTVTLTGEPVEPRLAQAALERLSLERPFVSSARYCADRAQIAYWDECRDAEEAAALALRMWSEHEVSAGLPAWTVVGLEVLDHDSVHRQWDNQERPRARALGEILPFDAPL